MNRKPKLFLLLCIAILALNPAFALDLVLENPQNTTYTSTLNIPLDFITTDNNGTCQYKLDGSFYPISPCENMRFKTNYDGSYLLEVYAYNTTASANANVSFTVDRSSEFEEGKPFLAGIIIMVVASLAFIFVGLSKQFQEEGIPVIKLSLAFGSVLAIVTALFLSIQAANEYLKFPSFEALLGIFTRGLFYIIVFVAVMVMILFIIGYLKQLDSLTKRRKW